MESLAYVLTSGWASGINVYATILVTGLLGRYGAVEGVPEVLERTDGQVRLWPAGLYGLLRELEKLDLIVESDKRPAADEDAATDKYASGW